MAVSNCWYDVWTVLLIHAVPVLRHVMLPIPCRAIPCCAGSQQGNPIGCLNVACMLQARVKV